MPTFTGTPTSSFFSRNSSAVGKSGKSNAKYICWFNSSPPFLLPPLQIGIRSFQERGANLGSTPGESKDFGNSLYRLRLHPHRQAKIRARLPLYGFLPSR